MVISYDREGNALFNGIPEAQFARVKRWGPRGPEPRPAPLTPHEVQKILPRRPSGAPTPTAPPRERLWPMAPEVRLASRYRRAGLLVVVRNTAQPLRRLGA